MLLSAGHCRTKWLEGTTEEKVAGGRCGRQHFHHDASAQMALISVAAQIFEKSFGPTLSQINANVMTLTLHGELRSSASESLIHPRWEISQTTMFRNVL